MTMTRHARTPSTKKKKDQFLAVRTASLNIAVANTNPHITTKTGRAVVIVKTREVSTAAEREDIALDRAHLVVQTTTRMKRRAVDLVHVATANAKMIAVTAKDLETIPTTNQSKIKSAKESEPATVTATVRVLAATAPQIDTAPPAERTQATCPLRPPRLPRVQAQPHQHPHRPHPKARLLPPQPSVSSRFMVVHA